jgi:Mrp family chromosome partitioning ATPase
VLSTQLDGFIFVVEWGKTPVQLVTDLLDAQPLLASKILGVLLNKTDMDQLPQFGPSGGPEKYYDRYEGYYQQPIITAPASTVGRSNSSVNTSPTPKGEPVFPATA